MTAFGISLYFDIMKEVKFMVYIESWMDQFVESVLHHFHERIFFIGLQGSYARNEAHAQSDIDVVVIFDKLSMQDLHAYDGILSTMEERENICGFVSGMEELLHWEPADLFQFYYDTKAYYGNLDALANRIDQNAVYQAVHMGACNIYHACVHNIIHEKSIEILKSLYKQAIFVLQAKVYYEQGKYIAKRKDLLEVLEGQDQAIVSTCLAFDTGKENDLEKMYEQLFLWSQTMLNDEMQMHNRCVE